MNFQRFIIDFNQNLKLINLKLVNLKTQSKDEIKVELKETHGGKDGRFYKIGRWSLAKILFMCHYKRVEFEKYGPTKSQYVQSGGKSWR